MSPGYDPPLRKDRSESYEGVMIAIHSGIVDEQILIDSDCEIVGAKVQINDPHRLIVLRVYRPTNNNKEYRLPPLSVRSSILLLVNFQIAPLAVGYWWFKPTRHWLAHWHYLSHQYRNEINNTFLELFSTLGLSQIVSFPIRINNTLDVFLNNRPTL